MPSKREPKWEVVDEIPGEEKPDQPPVPAKKPIWQRKTLWIGLAVGAALVFFLPVLRGLLQNLIRAWWLWLGLALYWIYRRSQRTQSRRK